MSADSRLAGLIAVAEDLAGEFALRPLLERILLRCTELLGCSAGSICSVDEAAGTYRKEADIGIACQSGRVFPLTEGMTGVVVAHRAPVWFDRYDEVRGGHVAPEGRATLRGVIGVPLEWRGRRGKLARTLVPHPGIEVAAEAADAAEALAACRELRPDVVLADLRLSGPAPDTGEGIIGALLGLAPGLPVVGVCEAGDEPLVAAAVRAGARGCVDAAADGPELARAVLAAARGQAYLSATVLARLQRGLRAEGPEPALTERERQVRALMEQGLPDKAIAELLVLSVKTVEKHAGAVLRKTGARNRTELAALAAHAGW